MIQMILQLIQTCYVSLLGYLKTNSFPQPLSKEEEKEALDKMAQGDMEAREKLISCNLRLVAHIVKKYENTKESTEDLISIGTIGLIKGIDTFKPAMEKRLSTYVSRCIENEILMTLRANKKNNQNLSLYEPVGFDKDGNEVTLIDMIKDEKQPDMIDTIMLKDNIRKLYQYFECLDEREKMVISKRYGLYKEKEMTQREIAEAENISRSYVSRIEKRAFTKLLRAFMKDNS